VTLLTPIFQPIFSKILQGIFESGDESGLLLDAYHSILAFSTRRLHTSHNGPLVQIERHTDNETQDIGFLADGSFDTATFNTFTSNGVTAYGVRTYYDQSGNNHNFIQATTTHQPTLDLATYDQPVLVFNGTADHFDDSSLSDLAGQDYYTMIAMLFPDTATGQQTFFSARTFSPNVNLNFTYINNAGGAGYVYPDAGSNVQQNGGNTPFASAQLMAFPLGASGGAIRINNSEMATGTFAAVTTLGLGAASIGRAAVSSHYFSGGIGDLILLPQALLTSLLHKLEQQIIENYLDTSTYVTSDGFVTDDDGQFVTSS
jgi:hypothetical protein